MSVKNNKICIICKTPYHYCPSCSSDNDKPSWYAIFDGDNCYEIYNICTAYRDEKIDKKNAYEKIKKCDLSKLDDFAESTKAQIKDIMSYREEVFEKKYPETKDTNIEKPNVQKTVQKPVQKK